MDSADSETPPDKFCNLASFHATMTEEERTPLTPPRRSKAELRRTTPKARLLCQHGISMQLVYELASVSTGHLGLTQEAQGHPQAHAIEIITNGGRRRRRSAAEKLRTVEETLYDGESRSAVARRNGVAPNLLYRWRKLMLEGSSIAVAEDDSVTGNRTVRDMESRVRELECQPGRKTMEVEILKKTLDKSRAKKNDLAGAVAETGRFPIMAVAKTLGVSCSNLRW